MSGAAAPADFLELSLREFLDRLAADARTPAGGSGAAVTVAIGASLVAMAARRARGAWEDAAGVVAQAEAVRGRAAALAVEVAEAYERALEALHAPPGGGRPGQRDFVIATALGRAADVPLRIAEAAADVAELGTLVAEQGDPAVRGDAVVAAVLGEAGVRAAGNLVAINLATRPDDERLVRAQKLVLEASAASRRALASARD